MCRRTDILAGKGRRFYERALHYEDLGIKMGMTQETDGLVGAESNLPTAVENSAGEGVTPTVVNMLSDKLRRR